MVQDGGWSTEKGSCTFNTRGKTRVSDLLFVMHGGRRHESCSSGFLRGEASSWWRTYAAGTDGNSGVRLCSKERASARWSVKNEKDLSAQSSAYCDLVSSVELEEMLPYYV